MSKVSTLKGIRYFFSAAVMVFVVCVLVNPYERAFIALTSLSLSLAVLFQALEIRASGAGERQYANYVMLLVASVANFAASVYAFSTVF